MFQKEYTRKTKGNKNGGGKAKRKRKTRGGKDKFTKLYVTVTPQNNVSELSVFGGKCIKTWTIDLLDVTSSVLDDFQICKPRGL